MDAAKAHNQARVDARCINRNNRKEVDRLRGLGLLVPEELLIPIRDPEKKPL